MCYINVLKWSWTDYHPFFLKLQLYFKCVCMCVAHAHTCVSPKYMGETQPKGETLNQDIFNKTNELTHTDTHKTPESLLTPSSFDANMKSFGDWFWSFERWRQKVNELLGTTWNRKRQEQWNQVRWKQSEEERKSEQHLKRMTHLAPSEIAHTLWGAAGERVLSAVEARIHRILKFWQLKSALK